MTAPTAPAPGYYGDPLDPSGERWWDGSAWTETVRPLGSGATTGVPTVEPDREPDRKPVPERVVVEPDPAPAAVESLAVPAVEPDRVELTPIELAPIELAPIELTPIELTPIEPVAAQPGLHVQAAEHVRPDQPAVPVIPPGLYPDPYGQAPLRWWDGLQWTTQTSQPVPPQPVSGVQPVAGHSAPRSAFTPKRPNLSELAGRFGRKSLAGVVVLLLALGVRVYFLFDGGSPGQPSPASIAAAVNLRSTDLPKTWAVEPSAAASGDDSDATGDAFQRAVDRCSGAPDHTTSVTFTSSSPSWTRGTSEISSDVDVLRSPALAQQDLRAQRGPKGASCVTKVGTPALQRIFAAKGVALTGLNVTRLPNAPADGFALRLKMTLSAHGRRLTVWNDAYGFVRGDVEVSLTQVSTGGAPDRTVALQALKQLRSRATTAIPTSSR